MLNPAHILEIALLLLVAFLIGAAIGSVARLVAFRLARPKTVALPEVASAPTVEAVASLVTAPVIEPGAKPATPVAPREVPAMDFTEALLALAGDKPTGLAPIKLPSITPLAVSGPIKPAAEMAPARAAGATTSGRLVAHPQVTAEPVRETTPAGIGADVIPFPIEPSPIEAEPVAPVVDERQPTPEPAVEQVVEAPPAAPAEMVVEAVGEAEDQIESPDEPAAGAPSASQSEVVSTDTAPPEVAEREEPAVEAVPVVVEPPPGEPIAFAPGPSDEDDEAAAMRAIEGNWSPRRGASGKARKVALPEGADEAVVASAAAVASAAKAVDVAVAAEPEGVPGKPAGLAAPRHGAQDDLTHVIGILPIIETALNRLGVYHYDQVAELTDENAGWIEAHLGISGRIGREHWREQARELAAAVAGAKKAAGKQ